MMEVNKYVQRSGFSIPCWTSESSLIVEIVVVGFEWRAG